MLTIFCGNSEKNRGDLVTRQVFSQFSRKRAHDDIIFKCDHIQVPVLYVLTKYIEIDMGFTMHVFYSSPKYKIWALFGHFFKSVIFRMFINVLQKNKTNHPISSNSPPSAKKNIASVLLLQNLGN